MEREELLSSGNSYTEFLAGKRLVAPTTGITVDRNELHPQMFEFQRDLTKWALAKGRCALFCDTGLGKTLMSLEYARQLTERGYYVLILAPLAVAKQTARDESVKWGIPIEYAREDAAVTWNTPIIITNYEMVERFDLRKFGGVILDESSCLKDYTSKIRGRLTELFRDMPFRLCCTATPAPNDIAEIANHAEFLGIMSRTEMLAHFFVHDDKGWRLKKHAREPFYRWLASWGMAVKRPSDLGYDDGPFKLPPLTITPYFVPTDWKPEGYLFPVKLKGIGERSQARKATLPARLLKSIEAVEAEPDEQWLIWCGTNDESTALATSLPPHATEVTGSDSLDWKELAIEWFTGRKCICHHAKFRAKLAAWEKKNKPTSRSITEDTGRSELKSRLNTRNDMPQSVRHITLPTSGLIESESRNTIENGEKELTGTVSDASSTPMTRNDANEPAKVRSGGRNRIQKRDSFSDSSLTELPRMNIGQSSLSKTAAVQSAERKNPPTILSNPKTGDGSILTTIMSAGKSEGSYAQAVTLDSESLRKTQSDLSEPQCICGHKTGQRILISKVSIFGFGLNLQNSARMLFCGLGDSYEKYYQAIRREWRFGQQREVRAYLVLSDAEYAIYENVMHKEAEAQAMSMSLIANIAEYERTEIAGKMGEFMYEMRDAKGKNWQVGLGDSTERMAEWLDVSVDFSVHSPPFANLYCYSQTERDLGNCKDEAEFLVHYRYIVEHLFRVTKPGRVAAVHCFDIPAMLSRDGYIGLKDFSGDLVKLYISCGWIWDARVPIDKNQQAAAIRTHAKGLTMTQLEKDRTWSRPTLPDYILKFRKPGENAVPVVGGDVSRNLWIEWANPTWPDPADRCGDAGAMATWYGIRETDTLQGYTKARAADDEKHIAPLQLETIERCIRLWSNEGELVVDPFTGIGSTGCEAVRLNRRFRGLELKDTYFDLAVANLQQAEREAMSGSLLGLMEAAAVAADPAA